MIREAVHLRELVRACTACTLRKTAKEPVPWRGATPAGYVVYGMAPGKTEDQEGKPFVGPAAWLLERHMKAQGFPMHDIAYTNAVQCFPGRDAVKKGDNRPVRGQMEACRPIVLATLRLLKPRWMLVVGDVALKSLRPDLDLRYHGRPLFFDWGSYDIELPFRLIAWVTYHPAAALRSQRYENDLSMDLKAFWEWRRTGENWPTDCWICGRDVERYDGWGVGTCGVHSYQQGTLSLPG